MARRTRQSQPRVVTNLSKEPTNEEDAMLQGSTNMNTTLQCGVGVQNQMIGHVQNNLRGASWYLLTHQTHLII